MDDKNLRQTVSATTGTTAVTGTTTTNQCTLGAQTGPIIVRQVVGEASAQNVLDIHVVVPDNKDPIEQIVDVFIKDVEVTHVEVITDKVIVRGEFEIKTIYVAGVPGLPVQALEIRHYKWTQDIDLPGARRGMDADANVVVEFVDYDIPDHHHHHHHGHYNTRAFQYKYGGKHHSQYDDDCDNNDCGNNNNDNDHDHGDCYEDASGAYDFSHCLREYDISVVLKITAKVMADREITMGAGTVPTNPKG